MVDYMGRRKVEISNSELKNLYEEKRLSTRKLAQIYNCGATTILRRLHKYNIKIRPSMSVKLAIPKKELKFLYEKKKKSTTQLAKIYFCDPVTIFNRLREYNIKIRSISEANMKYPKYNFSGDLIEKAYLVGFRLGDLYVGKFGKNGQTICIQCASTHSEQINLIKKLFGKYGHVHVSSPNNLGVIRIQCYLNNSFSFLLDKKDNIKSWILADDQLFFAFLAGYIDAEGDIGVHSSNLASFRLGSCDKRILNQIYQKLKQLGINSRLYLDRPKGSKVNLPRGCKKDIEYVTSKDFWRISIDRKESLLKLFYYIRPYLKHPKRKTNLEEAKKNIEQRNLKFGNLRMES